MKSEIRLMGSDDLVQFSNHMIEHINENFDPNQQAFGPFEKKDIKPIETIQRNLKEAWKLGLYEKGWERAWAFIEGSKILGHVDLKSGDTSCGLHRCTLGIGILHAYRSKGIGTRLLKHAIEWAKAQPSLEWMDLQVFKHNQQAISLYTKLGFVKTGEIQDLFRIRGQSVSDLSMTLKLRKSS